MAGQNQELPEGTDHIIQGAAQTRTSDAGDSGANQGFVAGGTDAQDTGGLDSNAGSSAGSGGFKAQVRNTTANLKGQATDKVRAYATDGKDRAAGAISEFATVFEDAARSIDDKLGAEYGQYARQAAGYVNSFSDTIRNKEVDELYADFANVVRQSPAIAIGVAAAFGFATVRIVKAGISPAQSDVTFKSASGEDISFAPAETAASAGAGAA